MPKYFSLLVFILFLAFSSGAQNLNTINGKVTDSDSRPIEFVNAILLKSEDSSLVKGSLSDASGNYSFEDVKAGSYLVMLSQTGFSKYYSEKINLTENPGLMSVADAVLLENTIQLKEATVIAQKPFIERRMDKTIVNVENSIVDAGSTAIEILRRSPGVVIDNEGNISIKGKQGVLVLIDDKPTYLSTSDLYTMLRNMSSDQLSTIEIITNPSARYDASGNSGILNIKLRKKQNLGMNGSLTFSYGQGQYPDFGGSTNLNYRNEKFNAFGSYNYMYGYYFENVKLDRRFHEEDHTSSFLQRTFDKGRYINHNYRAGVDYFLSDKQTIGLQLRGYNSKNRDRTTSRTEVFNYSSVADSGYVTENSNDSKWQNFSTDLSYRYKIDTLGKELNADLDYGQYNNTSDFRFQTDYHFPDPAKIPYSELATSDQPAKIDIRTIKLDYTHPISKSWKFEGGIKSSFVKTDSDVRYVNYLNGEGVPDSGKSNHFIYKENINAAFFSTSYEHNKLGIQLGLRAEQTIADGNQVTSQSVFHRNYVQFFPTAFLSYAFTDKQESRVSYSRRIDRPGYQQLNPFKYFLDPYNYMEGNPELEPQMTNSFELSHTLMKMFTVSINYSHTTKAMAQISQQIDSVRTTFVRTENLDANDNYGITLSIPVQIFKWWYSSNTFNLFNNRYKGISSVGDVDKRLSSYTANSYNSFSLPKSWAMELSGYYNSRAVWGTLLVDPHFAISAGFRKSFWEEKLTLRINVNDIFHTESFDSQLKYQNVDADFKRVFDSQFVRIHLSYNFGKKGVPKARQRVTSSQDEEQRINTGR